MISVQGLYEPKYKSLIAMPPRRQSPLNKYLNYIAELYQRYLMRDWRITRYDAIQIVAITVFNF